MCPKVAAGNTKPAYVAIIEAFEQLIQSWIDTMGYNTCSNQAKAEVKELAHVMKDHSVILKRAIPHIYSLLEMENNNNHNSNTNNTNNEYDEGSSTDFSVEAAKSGFTSMKTALQKLLRFLSKSNRRRPGNNNDPIVLFLDNFHSACPMSMDLVKYVVHGGGADAGGHVGEEDVEAGITGVVLILAYRDDEVDEDHWVSKGLRELEAEYHATTTTTKASSPKARTATAPTTAFHHVRLNPLRTDGINTIVSQLTERRPEETTSLSNIVESKTGGNPFFILQVRASNIRANIIVPASFEISMTHM